MDSGQDEGLELKFVIHDRDRKYSRAFDAVLAADGAEVIVTPLLAPTANALRSAGWARYAASAWTGW
ncbi:MAG TPA: hypothetical protein VND96_18475 [Candidatus Micrarchaeaceae archaeon]|nr:hypothetical protein [Candidatus Micrarchaeaceae archaeon]